MPNVETRIRDISLPRFARWCPFPNRDEGIVFAVTGTGFAEHKNDKSEKKTTYSSRNYAFEKRRRSENHTRPTARNTQRTIHTYVTIQEQHVIGGEKHKDDVRTMPRLPLRVLVVAVRPTGVRMFSVDVPSARAFGSVQQSILQLLDKRVGAHMSSAERARRHSGRRRLETPQESFMETTVRHESQLQLPAARFHAIAICVVPKCPYHTRARRCESPWPRLSWRLAVAEPSLSKLVVPDHCKEFDHGAPIPRLK